MLPMQMQHSPDMPPRHVELLSARHVCAERLLGTPRSEQRVLSLSLSLSLSALMQQPAFHSRGRLLCGSTASAQLHHPQQAHRGAPSLRDDAASRIVWWANQSRDSIVVPLLALPSRQLIVESSTFKAARPKALTRCAVARPFVQVVMQRTEQAGLPRWATASAPRRARNLPLARLRLPVCPSRGEPDQQAPALTS